MGTWTVRGTTIAPAMSIDQLEALAISIDGGTIYDETSGNLALTFSVEGDDIRDVSERALARVQDVPALESIEIRRW